MTTTDNLPKIKDVLNLEEEKVELKKTTEIQNIEDITDTEDEKRTFKLLTELSGKIQHKDKELMYAVIFSQKKGRYYPITVLDDGTILQIHNHLEELILEIVMNNEPTYNRVGNIPEWEKYFYFKYDDIEYRFTKKIFWDANQNINTVDNDVIHWLKNKKDFTKDIYNDTIDIIKDYYYHNFDFEYDVLASGIIQSYIYGVLGRVFYITFLGGMGSGKTTCLRTLSYLLKNGVFGGRGTVPSSVRMIDFFGISLCQDEFEKMSADEKQMFVGVMNNGFNEGGNYRITNMGNKDVTKQIVSFNSFCPKLFTCNSFYGFDLSFIDRCYPISSVKAGKGTKDIHQLSYSEIHKFQELRNKLFVYCLKHWKEIIDSINDYKTKLEKECCFGRF